MQRLKNFILSIDFNVLVFALLGIRAAFFGATVADGLIVLALCSLQGFNAWLLSQKQEPLSDQVQKELEDIKATMGGLLLKNSIKSNQNSKPPMRMF